MQMPSIFRRQEDQAPEVEVQGDEIVIRRQGENDESKPEDRKVKMPQTIFA